MAVIKCVKPKNKVEVLEATRCMLHDVLCIENASTIVPSARLDEDLEADSLSLVNVAVAVEANFGIEIPKELAIFGNFTVQSLADHISRRLGLEN